MMMRWNEVTRAVIGGAIEVHRAMGPGLLESTYEARGSIAEQLLGGIAGSPTLHEEEGHRGRARDPQPAALVALAPARLVDVDEADALDVAVQLLVRHREYPPERLPDVGAVMRVFVGTLLRI